MVETIIGLRLVEEYVSPREQAELMAVIDAWPWLSDLKRRVQHYGYRYDYTKRRIDQTAFLGPLPDWAAKLALRLHTDGWMDQLPEQVIVNEYLPGQGISSHVDCVPCFGDTILSLSLGAPCVMLFSHPTTSVQIPILLQPGSLVMMRDEARYVWRHSIPARKTDRYEDQTIVRGRRVSLTFRTILQSD